MEGGFGIEPVAEEIVETVTAINLFAVSEELEQAVEDIGIAVASLFEDVSVDVDASWLTASTLFQVA